MIVLHVYLLNTHIWIQIHAITHTRFDYTTVSVDQRTHAGFITEQQKKASTFIKSILKTSIYYLLFTFIGFLFLNI